MSKTTSQPDLATWLADKQIDDVEAFLPDIAGIPRGKIIPAARFPEMVAGDGLRINEQMLVQMVNGAFVEEDSVTDELGKDLRLVPDLSTLRVVPWMENPTAQVICDAHRDDEIAPEASRTCLKHVLDLYESEGLKPVIAPELEFYLVENNDDPDTRLKPAVGRSGRRDSGRQSMSIAAANEFDPVVNLIYDWAEMQGLEIDTASHEAGPGQLEINFDHGDPLALADQVLMFKRTVKEAATAHGMTATFMAKPMEGKPGSSMHIHQSIEDEAGKNLFSASNGDDTPLFHSFIAGLQRYAPATMPLFCPNVNSYRRLTKWSDAPINIHWGYDNRTVSLRVPLSSPKGRRVENRIPGSDANPYLAIAATLACGLLGIREHLEPKAPQDKAAYDLAHTLPKSMYDALTRMRRTSELKDVLGETLFEAVLMVKEAEMDDYQAVISPWERANLLLNV